MARRSICNSKKLDRVPLRPSQEEVILSFLSVTQPLLGYGRLPYANDSLDSEHSHRYLSKRPPAAACACNPRERVFSIRTKLPQWTTRTSTSPRVFQTRIEKNCGGHRGAVGVAMPEMEVNSWNLLAGLIWTVLAQRALTLSNTVPLQFPLDIVLA
jgi:hypothetical protein